MNEMSLLQWAAALVIAVFLSNLIGWMSAALLFRRLQPAPQIVRVDSLSREQRFALFGGCELCGEPAAGNVCDVDEGTTIRLCREHLAEAIRYHETGE